MTVQVNASRRAFHYRSPNASTLAFRRSVAAQKCDELDSASLRVVKDKTLLTYAAQRKVVASLLSPQRCLACCCRSSRKAFFRISHQVEVITKT